jgi:hypothetical protein
VKNPPDAWEQLVKKRAGKVTKLEKSVERLCCERAENRYQVRNVKLSGRVGFPDRQFMKNGKILLVEFKKPGEDPDKYQEHIHKQLRREGFEVHTVDNYPQFITILKAWLDLQ